LGNPNTVTSLKAPGLKASGSFLWRALNAASLATWLWSLGGGAVITTVVSALVRLQQPWDIVLAVGVFMLAAAAILSLRERPDRKPQVDASDPHRREEATKTKSDEPRSPGVGEPRESPARVSPPARATRR
ncbi:MAG TPA: hypothetical protein VII45_08635, partial [Solirubrobacterales bacterium]